MMPRVLHIIDSMEASSGGAPNALNQLIPIMHVMGVHTEIICFDDASTDRAESSACVVHRLGKGITQWKYHAKFAGWLDEHISRFDTIVVHGLWLYNLYCTRKAVVRYRAKNAHHHIRFYIMPHGMLDPWFQYAKGRRLKALRNYFMWMLVERNNVNRADGLLFTCDLEKMLASKTFKGYHPVNEYVIGLGSEQPSIQSISVNEKPVFSSLELSDHPYLLFMGRIDPKKGIDILLKAWKEVVASNAKVDTLPSLVIAGPGWDSSYGMHLLQSIQADPLLKRSVIAHGMLTDNDKWLAVYGCQAFILTSYQENFGVAVSEALSCGRPVLITDAVNIYDRVISENCGIVAKASVAGIVNMLNEWLSTSEEDARLMSARAKSAWEKHFRLTDTASNLYSLIHKSH